MTSQSFRPRAARDLLERAEAGWLRFIAAVRDVGTLRFDDPTPAGWRYRDLVAHVSVWHRICVENVEHIRAHGRRLPGPFPPVDEVNADAARAATGKDPEALVRELEQSWESLRAAITGLPDERLAIEDGWVIEHVAENTWEHYEEHLAEVRAAAGEGGRST